MRRLGLALALAASMLLAPQAHADELFVTQGGGGTCSQASPCSLAVALTQANATPVIPDTIRVQGSLTQATAVNLSLSPIELIGSGTGDGGTFIDVPGGPGLVVGNSIPVPVSSSARNLRVRSTGAGPAVTVAAGSTLSSARVEATGSGATAVTSGAFSAVGAATVEDSVISASSTGVGYSGNMGSVTVRDSRITAPIGIFLNTISIVPGVGPTHSLQRTTIDASAIGVSVVGATLQASSSVIRMSGTNSAGIVVQPSSAPFSISASGDLRQMTIDGADSTGSDRGVLAAAGVTGAIPTSAGAAVRGSVIRGFDRDLAAAGSVDSSGIPPAPLPGLISVAKSNFATSQGMPGSGTFGMSGSISDLGGNLNVDPGFVDRPGGDYRLRFDSPMVDSAGTAATDPLPPTESPTDRAGSQRILDGNADGSAARDMGAFEYLFARPDARISGPERATVGEEVSFDASSSSFSTGPIVRYEWDLDGDGSFETDTGSAPRASRVYSAPGQVTVRIRTTGFDGGAAEASRTLTVDPPAVAQDLEGPTLRFLGRLATLTPGGILTFRIGCAAAEPTPCAGPVTVQTATAVLPAARRRRVIRLGRTRFSVQPGRVRTVRVRLSRKSMRLVRVRNLKRVRVVALPRDLAGNVKRNEKVFRLRLQRRG